MQGRVLIIAGSDSGGGAGIQADIKTVTALGGYASTAITALTAQNTLGVQAIHRVPLDFLRAQIGSVLSDLGADVIKTGMLGDAATIEAVCDALEEFAPRIPVVVDPVMVAKGGARLLADDALSTLKRRLLPRAVVLTPNLPEAEALCDMSITDTSTMRHAAQVLLTLGVPAVLLKGGHLEGNELIDLLASKARLDTFQSTRIQTRHTHGTGCTTASAVAVGLAQGMELRDAVIRARAYVRAAILAAPCLGGGHGPLGHGVTMDPEKLARL
ncbi:MAG: bifunctional hydroxymethylpyrimidine kinase/phosphomethylpyrimidine kinase [Acetobacteraceae bacterium]|nr:bifunctional hydroxymethylpyrimidine kinase/phosphomethylpyrimidine kinase [Acetobacteraceae bacterium]